MLIHCEECGKGYTIDEKKITGQAAYLKCTKCGNRVKIARPTPMVKPKPVPENQGQAPSADDRQEKSGRPKQEAAPAKVNRQSGKGRPRPAPARSGGFSIGAKLITMFLSFILILGSVLACVYLKYVPALMTAQINLRAYSVSSAFSNAVLQPLLLRNYLQISKNAEVVSKLPGVAYATVLNKRGALVSGLFGDMQRFSADFVDKVEKEGFPWNLSSQNRVSKGAQKSEATLTAGGQEIYDVGVAIGNTGGEAHVGLFTESMEKAVYSTLMPLLITIAVMAIMGIVGIIFLTRTISRPIKLLTAAADRINCGEIDASIDVKGGGEIADLSAALERMRQSVQAAIERLRRK